MLSLAISRSELWKSIKNSCEGDPTLLGICSFDEKQLSPVPSSFDLFGSTTKVQLSYVLYDAHTPQSLRFYILEPPQNELSLASPKNDSYGKIAKYDFTRRNCRQIDNAINEIVINQVYYNALYNDINLIKTID